MARLRVRVELNRGGVGIPLHKLASVVHEAQGFFQMLAHDVHIANERGEWLAFDLDNGSLNFTAEYVGPVSSEQVNAFYAAFDGVTSLRRATIAQFTRIADAIGEDELIGFGLYKTDQESEPSEWRCLSRRDALRIADEIRILQGAAGELEMESHLRAVIDSDRGARLFKERHSHAAGGDQSKWANFVRAVESNLANRISRLEGEVEGHSVAIRDLRQASAVTEESFRNLLSSVEKFCGQATNQLEKLSPQPQLLVAPPPSISNPAPQPEAGRRRKIFGIVIVLLLAIGVAAFLFWPSKPPAQDTQATASNGSGPVEESSAKENSTAPVPLPEPSKTNTPAGKAAAPVERPEPGRTSENVAPPAQSPEGTSAMYIELEAREPAWVSITDVDGNVLLAKTLQANETHSLELTKGATLRTGNAGALVIRFNGKDVGPLGPSGKIRDVEFKEGTFRIRAPSPGQNGAAG